MHRAITENRDAIGDICRHYGVSRLEVFGSAARGDDFKCDDSDADFLVEFAGAKRFGPLEEYFGLREALSALLKRSVDLGEPGAVKNPYVRRSINSTREVVCAA